MTGYRVEDLLNKWGPSRQPVFVAAMMPTLICRGLKLYFRPPAIRLLSGVFRSRCMKSGPAIAPAPAVAKAIPQSPAIPDDGCQPEQRSNAQPNTVGEIMARE